MSRPRQYQIVIHPAEPGETGYWVEVPALPGCITQGETLDECVERAREAIAGHVEALLETGQPVPEEAEPPADFVLRGSVAVQPKVA